MGDVAIKFENISKQYRLGTIGTGTISHDLNRWWAKMRGKEDPFLKVTEVNDRASKTGSGYVWALKDINLEVKHGEVLGIIGKNGAGKSTLLKILSRVTSPTTGVIKAKGRIASLLEVGTGFHPEMTGRENIFMNGSIMGMTKAEIITKLDEIIDFSGVEKYIDTPVKRYSSGMTVRLGFAIAAHLEPEILVVDEVLAVGDADFQKKALGKMQDVSRNEGRTVLFVSHNMAAVKELCNHGLLLQNGIIGFKGNAIESINNYQSISTKTFSFDYNGDINHGMGNEDIKILKFSSAPLCGDFISISSGFIFSLIFLNNLAKRNIAITFELRNLDETVIFHQGTWLFQERDSSKGTFEVKGIMPPNILNAGIFKLNIIFAESFHSVFLHIKDFILIEILNESILGNNQMLPGIMRSPLDIESIKLI